MKSEPVAGGGSGAERVIANLADAVTADLTGKRLADPISALSAAARLERLSREVAERAAAAAIAAGMSWTDVGTAYGISRQAAHQRFARHVRRLGK